MSAPSLLVVGGYGVVGSQLCRMFAVRNPQVRLMIAGRSAEKASAAARALPGATGVRVDVSEDDPLAALDTLPDAIVVAVNDDHEKLLCAAIARGIAIADIARWTSRVEDAARLVAQLDVRSPVVLASGWMAGAVTAAINAVRAEGERFGQVDIDILFYAADKAGPDSIAGWVDIHHPFPIWENGERRQVRSLADPHRQTFPSGKTAMVRRFSAPDQETLVLGGAARGVAVRMGFDSPFLTGLFATLVDWGLWGRLPTGWRKKLLYNPGTGARHEVVVTLDGGRKLTICDGAGQTHLTAAGAVVQAERLLGLNGRVQPPSGVSYPEQAGDGARDLSVLRELGVEISYA